MGEFAKLFKKVGGFQILRQYARGHVLIYAFLITAMNGVSGKSLEIVRLSVRNKLLKRLRKKYKKIVSEYVSKDDQNGLKNGGKDREKYQRKVWVCWFQGTENAPDVVKKCYKTLHQYIRDREIVLITEENYRDYVNFPEHIEAKGKAGIISKTHLSDLLRLELLKNYGGTWIDATVFLTGQLPGYMLDSELFLFQNLKPGASGHSTNVSSWFMTAEAGNKIVMLTLVLLYEYWKKNNGVIDYFIFHDFFQIAIETYPDEWKRVVPFSNSTPHILLLRLFEKYDESVWEAVKVQSTVHKLSYKNNIEDRVKSGTYYQNLIGEVKRGNE